MAIHHHSFHFSRSGEAILESAESRPTSQRKPMNSESLRISDQLRRAFTGEAWHGPSLHELLAGITAEQARTRPLPSGHTIWELVLHIELWARIAFEATKGVPM